MFLHEGPTLHTSGRGNVRPREGVEALLYYLIITAMLAESLLSQNRSEVAHV